MTDTILAQGRDLDGWIQGIVVLLVIGGSVLKPIVNALIKHFGPKDPASPAGRARSGSAPHAPARPTAVPGASPVSSRPRSGVPGPVAAPPVARAPQARPIAPPHRPGQTAPGRPRPPAPPKPLRTTQRPTPAPQKATRKRAVSRTEDRLGHLEPTAREHLGHVDSVIELRDDQLEHGVDEHLGHLAPATAPTASKKRAVQTGGFLARPTRSSLRRAVVLSEVLQPPLALRRSEG